MFDDDKISIAILLCMAGFVVFLSCYIYKEGISLDKENAEIYKACIEDGNKPYICKIQIKNLQ